MANNEHELLSLPGSKSAIWAYFGFLAKEGKFVEKDKRKRKQQYVKRVRESLCIPEVLLI